MEKTPNVFISYSWTTTEHEEKVLALASRLMGHGVKVIIDKWDLKEGQDKYVFMEQSVTNPEIDRVLLLCDKAYVEKADNRTGGVGDETMIISPEIYGKAGQEKFIPVIFEKDIDNKPYIPAYIKSRIYLDLSDEDSYENEYDKLLRNIHCKPLYKKPVLGNVPEWLQDDESDLSPLRDIIKQIKGSSNKGVGKINALIRCFNDSFITAMSSYVIKPPNVLSGKIVIEKIEKMKPLRDSYIDLLDILMAQDVSLSDKVTTFFESTYNAMFSIDSSRGSYSTAEFDHFKFLIWDMFICTIAFLYHFEKYADIKELVCHTYFLKKTTSSTDESAEVFTFFRRYLRTIEEDYKPKSEKPNLFSLSADMLINREKLPVITKNRIVEADILLCQLSIVYAKSNNVHKSWFPDTYVYNENANVIWKRLISRKYCEKTMVMYDAKNIPEFKDIAEKSSYTREIRHNNCFESAPCIATSITIESIGTMP